MEYKSQYNMNREKANLIYGKTEEYNRGIKYL